MLPLLLLAAAGIALVAMGGAKGKPTVDDDLARLRKDNPTAAAEVERILREGASSSVLLQYGAQLDAGGYHAVAARFAEMAKVAGGADPAAITNTALASKDPGTMKSAAAQLRSMGYNAAATQLDAAAEKLGGAAPTKIAEVSKTIEPSMGPELQTQLDKTLATEGDPARLTAMASTFEAQGYPNAAKVLREKAASIHVSSEAADALRATDAVVNPAGGGAGAGAASGVNPTTAAVTATKAANVANATAEAIANPTTEGVKDAARKALALAQSAPSGVASRALLVAAQAALQNPNAQTLATMNLAAAELAKASATPDTAGAAGAAADAARKLEANPTAVAASQNAAVAATAAATAIRAGGVPIAEPGKTTYVVQRGDNPWSIAQKVIGNGQRYGELIKSNAPPKKLQDILDKSGQSTGRYSFASLNAGEVLKLPSSWVKAAPTSTIVADSRPAGGGAAAARTWADDLEQMAKTNPSLYESTIRVRNATPPNPAALMKASEILQAQYPLLSVEFKRWAADASMRGTAPAAIPILTSAPGAASTPPGAPQTYAVQRGDSPWRIAERLAGSGQRWKELVAANPKKSRGADGNFKFLNAGETLALPASWSSASPTISAGFRPPRPARSPRDMGYHPFAA